MIPSDALEKTPFKLALTTACVAHPGKGRPSRGFRAQRNFEAGYFHKKHRHRNCLLVSSRLDFFWSRTLAASGFSHLSDTEHLQNSAGRHGTSREASGRQRRKLRGSNTNHRLAKTTLRLANASSWQMLSILDVVITGIVVISDHHHHRPPLPSGLLHYSHDETHTLELHAAF